MSLHSERTVFTPIIEEDIAEILGMYQEPDSFKYIYPLQDKSLEFYTEFLHKKIRLNKEEIGFWVVRNHGELIGTVNLNLFMDTGFRQIGCHLRRKHWGKGYASELLPVLIEYGFRERGYPFLYGVFQKENEVSKKLLEGLKFSFHQERLVGDVPISIYELKNLKS